MIDNGDYILPGLTRPLYLQLLRSASRERGYSDAEARVSLLLDVDRCTAPGSDIKSQRAYGRLWGWSHKKVRLEWEGIWQDVARIASSNGRQIGSPFVAKLPVEWLTWLHSEYPDTPGAHEGHSEGTGTGTENPADDAKKGDPGHTKGTAGAQPGHTTTHPSSSIPSSSQEPPQAPQAEAPGQGTAASAGRDQGGGVG